jgi:hypothetical protein
MVDELSRMRRQKILIAGFVRQVSDQFVLQDGVKMCFRLFNTDKRFLQQGGRGGKDNYLMKSCPNILEWQHLIRPDDLNC